MIYQLMAGQKDCSLCCSPHRSRVAMALAKLSFPGLSLFNHRQPQPLTASTAYDLSSKPQRYFLCCPVGLFQLATHHCALLPKRKHALTRTYSLSLLALAHVQMLCLRGHHRVVKLIQIYYCMTIITYRTKANNGRCF